jgi:hypothetical protein
VVPPPGGYSRGIDAAEATTLCTNAARAQARSNP